MKFSRQPLIWLNLVGLLLALAASFGFSLTKEQTAAVMAVLQALAVAVGWTQVTPVATARQQVRSARAKKATAKRA